MKNGKSDSSEETIPPTRLILDLDQPMLLQALLECLEMLANPPLPLEQPGDLRQWRCRVWVRLSYLLTHCSLTRSGNSSHDLRVLAQHHSSLAQRLLAQDQQLSRYWDKPLD